MYVLFDIGGTKTRVATTRNLKSFSKPVIVPTPKKYAEGIAVIADVAKQCCGGQKITAVAGSAAASPNRERTKLVGGGPNIADWLNKPLKKDLEKKLKAPVHFENDTAMGGLAQVVYGPAKGCEIVVYMTVSTGVGGCRIVHGKIDESAMGFEPGHQIMSLNPLRGKQQFEDLEFFIGGASLQKQEGKDPSTIKNKKFWDAKAKILAHGLHNISVMWSPDIMVIGGSVMQSLPLARAKLYLVQTLTHVFPTVPRITKAKFGDTMGLWGAMAYLKSEIRSKK